MVLEDVLSEHKDPFSGAPLHPLLLGLYFAHRWYLQQMQVSALAPSQSPPPPLGPFSSSVCSTLKQNAALTTAYRDLAAALTCCGILVTGAAITH